MGLTVGMGMIWGGTCLGGNEYVNIAEGQTIPVIAQVDVLVVGSSLDGCFLAQRTAKQAQTTVILASADTSLPREIAICRRPWVTPIDLNKTPSDIKSFLTSCTKEGTDHEIILDMIKVTEGLEDRLLDAEVKLYYDLHPCGVRMVEEQVTAVIFACKGGLVAVEANTIVDCTPDARVASLAGAKLTARESANKGILVRYSMLCKNPPEASVLTIKDIPELRDCKMVMHGNVAEFRLRVSPPTAALHDTFYGLEARRVAATLVERLVDSGIIKETTFVRGGDLVLADPVKRIVSRSSDKTLSPDACRPKGVSNLLVCGPAVDVDDAVAKTLVEPFQGPSLLEIVANTLLQDKPVVTQRSKNSKVHLSLAPTPSGRASEAQARFTELSPIYRIADNIAIEGIRIPVIEECEVLVVGAGTSGMPAATVAARQGADTIVIEKYGDVGGTHTIGGVSKYWYGRRTPFLRRLDSAASEMMSRTHMPKCMGQLHTLLDSGARLLTHCFAVGAVVKGRTVTGVVIVTPQGLAVINAKRIVDATGDGDIAARAGSSMTYGTRRDAMTLWYSFAQFAGSNPEARRHFAYVVDPRDPTDMTRAIIAGRRFKKTGKVTEPQYYLTPRETRHIQGAYRVTVSDILAKRRFEDLLLICEANFDIKGIADSDLSFSGYVEWARLTNYSVQIPYRAIRPVDLDNILVVGKAYSVSHDALALARMQRDMVAMGGAAGLIAARSVRDRVPFKDVDIKDIQKELCIIGVLSSEDLKQIEGIKDNELPPMSKADLRRYVAQLAAGKLPLDRQVQILVRPKASIPILKEALPKADRKGKIELAKALCFLGDTSASKILLDELERLLRSDKLPGLTRLPAKRMKHPLPDHGFAPEPTYLLNTLARLGDKRIVPFMTTIAKKVEAETEHTGPMFSYVFSICYAAERLGDPACVEALLILADKQGIRNGVHPRGTDLRKTARGLASRREDRYAYLELCVGRALARCGSRRGYDIMLRYLHDIRGFLARSAHDELVDLAGRDFGYDKRAWQTWLSSASVTPKPYHHKDFRTSERFKANKSLEDTSQ